MCEDENICNPRGKEWLVVCQQAQQRGCIVARINDDPCAVAGADVDTVTGTRGEQYFASIVALVACHQEHTEHQDDY
jgi:hypothetical protein